MKMMGRLSVCRFREHHYKHGTISGELHIRYLSLMGQIGNEQACKVVDVLSRDWRGSMGPRIIRE